MEQLTDKLFHGQVRPVPLLRETIKVDDGRIISAVQKKIPTSNRPHEEHR